VNNETQHYLELLDRRIVLLGTLAESLVEARKDIRCLDVTGLQAKISRQEYLCRQVGALDGQLNKLQEQYAARLRTSADDRGVNGDVLDGNERKEIAARLAETRERMKSAQGRVKRLNTTHQELLRRCRRTAGALLNLYATFEATYSEPLRARNSAQGRV
jgi:hypothetical protein